MHRILAYVVVILIIIVLNKTRKLHLNKDQKNGVNALLILVGLQFLLGVLTILMQVPVWLGVAHQIGAFFLLTATVFVLHRFSK